MDELRLYRLVAVNEADYGETQQAVVWATSKGDALEVLAEAFAHPERYTLPGYVARSAGPYRAEEVPIMRGLVLAEGQDG